MPRLLPRLLFLISLRLTAAAAASEPPTGEGDTIHIPPRIEWEKIAELPPQRDGAKHPGLASAFAGAHGDAFLIAGGNYYPQGPPWNGGARADSAEILVLERFAAADGLPVFKWADTRAALPAPVSCGASVSLDDGVLCIGGVSGQTVRDDCLLLSWNAATRTVSTTPFPELPAPLACHAAVLLKNTVYVLGGTRDIATRRATNAFYALDLTKRTGGDAFAWKALTPWDGPARIFPVAAASREGDIESLYLCGGRDPGNEPDFLVDLHKFNPVKKEWSLLGDVVDRRGHPGFVIATPAFHVPPHHFVVVGGMDEDITRLLERNARDLKELDDTERRRRKNYEARLMEEFPGYPRTVLGYDAEIGEWNHIGNFPGEVPLTNPAVNWDTQVVIPGGETGPGRRSAEIWAGIIRKKPVVVEEEPEVPAPAGAHRVSAPPAVPGPAAPGPEPEKAPLPK